MRIRYLSVFVLAAGLCQADSFKQMKKDNDQEIGDMYKEQKETEKSMRQESQELNNEQDKGWHKFLKEQTKPDKPWSQATKQEQKDFRKWWKKQDK